MRYMMAISLVGFLMVPGAIGETYVVDPEAHGGDFPNIQAAVDAVQDGDIIELTDGTFTGDGNRDVNYLGKAITIRSQGGPDVCTIDCEASVGEPRRGFIFEYGEGSGSVLQGVTVIHGDVPGMGYMEHGDAVLCHSSSPTIENCIFRENGIDRVGEGGALYCTGYEAFPTVVDCQFINNVAYSGGGASLCSVMGSGTALFERCTFAENHAEWGGGIRT